MELLTNNNQDGTAAGARLLERSALFRNFSEQRQEVLKHKWVLSEQAGHDVGFEAALLDWMVNHRGAWARQRRRA